MVKLFSLSYTNDIYSICEMICMSQSQSFESNAGMRFVVQYSFTLQPDSICVSIPQSAEYRDIILNSKKKQFHRLKSNDLS